MAKLELEIREDFDALLSRIEDGVLEGSISASLEETSDMFSGRARCSVRVFERYSMSGSNRVSLSVTLFQHEGEPVHLCAIASGGSQGVFFKLNTWGEESFLDALKEIL